jgi:hypothetical protein
MDYNSDRLAILSGVISRDEYTDKLLVEDRRDRRGHRRLNEMEATVVLSPETPEELAAVDDLALDPEAVDVEPSPEATMTTGGAPEEAVPEETLPAPDAEALPEEEPLPEPMTPEEEELEERLRRAIRHEVQSVLAEVQAKQEEAQLERGRRMKSVGVSMGFTGFGFKGSKSTPSRNSATSRGPGGMRGFGGPGFM